MNKTQFAENYIRNKINKGEWNPGFILPNTTDLAKEIGVSKFTLGEAFKPLVDQGIIVRKSKLGTVVNKHCSAQSGIILTIGSSRYVSDYAGGYLEQTIMMKSQAYLSKKDYQFKLATGMGKSLNDFMDSMHVLDDIPLINDTIGVLNTLGWFPLEEFNKKKIPSVSFSAFHTSMRNEVIVDVCSVFRNAIDILKSHKSKKICLLNMDFTSHSLRESFISMQKENLIKNTLENLRLENNLDVLNLDVDKIVYGKVYDAFKNYCKENPDLDAIFIADDSMLVEVFRVIYELGYRIPEDLKIICWTNKDRNYGMPITWTKFEQNIDDIVENMFNILIRKINGDTSVESIATDPKFIMGDSL